RIDASPSTRPTSAVPAGLRLASAPPAPIIPSAAAPRPTSRPMSPATPPPHHLTASPSPVLPRPPVLNLPNLLTTARLGLAVILFVCIAQAWWLAGAATFALAAVTDWLDGYLARKQGLASAFGRNFDPLVDKVLVCGAFIFLLPVPGSGLAPWMVTVVVGRELVITGLRSFLETQTAHLGADWP